jgi:predicted small metal-binding protein
MKKKVRCEQDLGVVNCDLVVEGDDPGEVAAEYVEHLRDEHDMDMPDAETITNEEMDIEDLGGEVRTVVRRLREALGISAAGMEDEGVLSDDQLAVSKRK